MKYLIGLVGVLMVLGCSKRETAVIVPHYDLSSQLRKHIKALYAEKAYVIKYVVYNGKPDQVVNRKPDWNKEFDVLFEADLHVPALIGLYDIDTTFGADSSLQINYTAKKEDETIRNLVVNTSHQGDLLSFDAVMETGSWLNRRTQTISYQRFRSFKIDVKEDNKYTSDSEYHVIGEVHMQQEYFQ